MNIHLSRSVIAIALGLMAVVSMEFILFVNKADAIPAFARKYGFTCNVCHVPGFPKLNDLGNTFRDQGYQLGADEDLPTNDSITMGYWPVSFRTTVGYQAASVRADGKVATSGSFGFTGLDILSFGTLHRHLSFGVVLTPGLGGAGFGNGGSAGEGDLEAAYVRLNSLERFLGAKGESYLVNLKVGKFEIEVPFSEKRSPTLNSQFVMYHYMAGTPWSGAPGGLIGTNTYGNPNDFQIGENAPAAELAGYTQTPGNGYFRYSLNAISNSNLNAGTGGVGGGRGVNFYGRMTQSFGGYGIVTGHRIGIFGAYGNSPTVGNAVCGTPGGAVGTCTGVAGSGQPFSRIGADVSLTYEGQWNLFGAFMHANDSKNLFVGQTNFAGSSIVNPQNASWNGAFVELDWYPSQLPFVKMPGWLLIYRYDLIRNTQQADPSVMKSYNDVDSHTAMVRYYIHQSTRTDLIIHAEYNWYSAHGVGTGGGSQIGQVLLVGLDFAY